MSLNLIFVKKDGDWIDFPFQTPTYITKAFINEPNKKIRIKMIREQLKEWGWTKDNIKLTMSRVKELMDDPNLEISYT